MISTLSLSRVLAETCPRCSAESGAACTLYGREVESHVARARVSSLRVARGWVPVADEPVRIGSPGTEAHARFVGFTVKGAARVDLGGIRVPFDVDAIYPAGGAS